MTASTVAVIGYASIDSSTAIDEFRGLDATSILRRPIVAAQPGMGGIAHLASAVASAGGTARAVSWVGPDPVGSLWTSAVMASGADVTGVAVSGTRSPAATLIEVASGGTICLFDPGDCHLPFLTPAQIDIIASSDWVLVTVAPAAIATQLLDVLPDSSRLVWAVKHDEDAYTPAILRRILARADIVSFSRGERPYVTIDAVPPEVAMRPGSLVIETRGSDGVAWSTASADGGQRAASIAVESVDVDDTTGAGDTFIGDFIGRVSRTTFPDLPDAELVELVSLAARASGDLLRSRTTPDASVGAPHKENHT
jgi:sugar/nucleoside kinase (ribokinase family)